MVTHRKANVQVVNDTGARVRAVSIVHKYSNNYVNPYVWETLEPGATSSPLQVDYHTGFLTTGRDWWIVAWVSDDGGTLYYTSPHNLRNIVDMFEKVSTAIAAAVGAVITSESGGWGAAVGTAIVAPFVNTESTVGFKQHILRAEDQLTKIHIANSGVTWVSPSGTSRTGIATSVVPKTTTSQPVAVAAQ